MKYSSAVLFALVFFVISTISSSFAQLPWTKDPNNPVLSGGASGAWNHYVYWPSVLYNPDSARYEMWYSGSAGSPLRPMNIGFAYSSDGITWTKLDTAVLKPDPGSWDESSVEGVSVIREDGGTYKMWYSGSNSVNDHWSIGYATSSNGINWIKDPNPVMNQGPAAWEAGGVAGGRVLYNEDSTRYEMWYGGYTLAGIGKIGYATSANGTTWTKLDTAVLDNGGSGTWDEHIDEAPCVLYLDGTYHMWFAGIPQSFNPPWQIGWATSGDGIHWNKYDDPSTTSQFYSESDPVLQPDNGQWDGSSLEGGTVMRIGDTLHFWYTGVLNPQLQNLWRIGHATAPYDSLTVGISKFSYLAAPSAYNLIQNYPNPFNPTTNIEFSIPKSEFVTLKVYNILGGEVATLVSEKLAAGQYKYDWSRTAGMASGVYLYRIQAGGHVDAKKMVLIR